MSRYDIVIVGTGLAGSAAATAAIEADADLDVAVIERAPEGDHAGNSRYTGAAMRLNEDGTPAPTREEFVQDYEDFQRGRGNRALIETLADEAKGTVEWLQNYGIEFVTHEDHPSETYWLVARESRRLFAMGGGIEVVETLLEEATARGVTVHFETTAQELTQSSKGAITGVQVREADGQSIRFETDAVVLASGGFQGNPRMLAQYVDGNVTELDPIVPGGHYDMGDGIRMALDVGAGTSGAFKEFMQYPIDPRVDVEEAPEPKNVMFPYGILVNEDGERFVDEGATTPDEHHTTVAARIREQPDGIAYLVADQKLFDIPDIDVLNYSPEDPYEAQPDYAGDVDPLESTLLNLASQIYVDAARLVETVEEFNESVQPGEFDPESVDGKSADTTPPKSNWAQRLDTVPFVAWPIACGNVFTFGGLKIDTNGRVLSRDRNPIPGLYAAGEVTGLYYHKYLGATSVLRSLVFGRRGGMDAVRFVREKATD